MRGITPAVFAILLVLNAPAMTAAHSPSAGTKDWAGGGTYSYKWAAGVPTWLSTLMTQILETDWAAAATNNSGGPRFAYGTSGSATVYFSDTSVCDSIVPGWLGCAAGAGTTSWRIWIRAHPSYHWCQVDSSAPCWDAGHIGIHETAHVGGYLNDVQGVAASDTVMVWPSTGALTHQIQRCDEARFQLWYDMATPAGMVADCFDHIANHGTYGLQTKLTATSSLTQACFGQGIAVTGRLGIGVDPADYLALSDDPLGQRTVYIDRRLTGTTLWSPDYSTTTSGSSTGSWSKTFSMSGSSGSVSYDFRAHFKKPTGEGLDETFSPIVTLTWSFQC